MSFRDDVQSNPRLDMWGGGLSTKYPIPRWKEIAKVQKVFLCHHHGLKATMSYSVMLLEMGVRLITLEGLMRVHNMAKVKNVEAYCLPIQALDDSTKIAKDK